MTKPAQDPSIRCFVDLVQLSNDTRCKSFRHEALSTDEVQHLKSIETQATNSLMVIPDGLAAIGELLAYACDNVQPDTLRDVGFLIKELANQVTSLNTYKEDAAFHLAKHELLQAKQVRNGGIQS